MTLRALFPLLFILTAAVPAVAQVGLPQVNLPGAGQVLDPLGDTVGAVSEDAQQSARSLLRVQQRTLDRFIRRNARFVEADRDGNPARRGELLLLDLTAAQQARLEGEGFAVLGREEVEGLGFAVTRLSIPSRLSLAQAEELAARLAPDAGIAPDSVHFQSGAAPAAVAYQAGVGTVPSRIPVGMIDGAPAPGIGTFVTRGFATGAPLRSNHGSAIASLLGQAGVQDIRVADVYGSDPAGGGALAIAQALGWLVQGGSRVVTISLVGPRNTVVERAIRAATDRGTVIVAAVGNNGPAAAPAYPASYPGVVAVTGVDGRNRALLEAGRALHLDYAAPGADVFGRDVRGRRVRLRGTSYATPLVAARVAAALQRSTNWRRTLDAEAHDLGEPGADQTYGRGLLCGTCGRS
jgi:subtilisin family serine protease